MDREEVEASRPAQHFMKETDGGEGVFKHLLVMYPLDVDQLRSRASPPTVSFILYIVSFFF